MSTLGWIHITFAGLAMLSGAVVLLRRKGTRSHRATGWIYVVSMVGLNVTALMIYRLFGGFGPFHIAAIVSLMSLFTGVYFVVMRPTRNWLALHYSFISWSYVGLIAAFVSEVGTRVKAFHFWWAVLIGTVLVIGVGGWMIKRSEKRTVSRFGRLATERVPRRAFF